MPPLSFDDAIETTKIYSVSGQMPQGQQILKNRPFRSPHHTMSPVSLVGGGAIPQPGEISLAHNGVLFLDEFPEFPTSVIEALRQPIEDKKVTIPRAAAKTTFPCDFMLVAAMNPCKCGYFGHPSGKCTCRKGDVHKYISRISGPMLDRFDIQVEMSPLTADELTRPYDGEESSAIIRERVLEARDFANRRLARLSDGAVTDTDSLSPEESLKYCVMDEKAVDFMKKAYDRLGLSARGYDRMVRLSRTIADMSQSDVIEVVHISEALQMRSLDKKYWYEN